MRTERGSGGDPLYREIPYTYYKGNSLIKGSPLRREIPHKVKSLGVGGREIVGRGAEDKGHRVLPAWAVDSRVPPLPRGPAH